MSKPIVFHTGPWTVGDLLMAMRIERNDQDIEALVTLLVSRSDASAETILALPMSELETLVKQMAETLHTAGVMDGLARSWRRREGAPQ
jgi:hypothetical protein